MPIDWRSAARVAAALVLLAVALFCFLILIGPAHARPGSQWQNVPEQIREWFQSVMQPENPYQSCCGESEAYDVEMAGNGSDGSLIVKIISGPTEDEIGRTIDVPRAKLQTKYGPTGRFILFMGIGERIYCLIPIEGV